MMTARTAASAGPAQTTSRNRLTVRRFVVTLVVLLVAVTLLSLFAIAVGSEHVSITSILKIVASKITGRAADVSPEQKIIILDIRFPRVVMAVVVGAALSVAGVFAESLPIGRPLLAFIGAVVTTLVVYALGQTRQGGSSERLVLGGIIINALLSSWVIFLVTNAPGLRQRSVMSWLIGYLGSETRLLPVVSIFIIIGIIVIYLNARSLNLMMTGEQDALALGVDVKRVTVIVYLAASLITGAAVAVSGVIGFVGLIIPHAVRLAGGSDNRLVVPASALAGGAFLLLADTVARTIVSPLELHVGVITASVGAPVFIYLLRRTS